MSYIGTNKIGKMYLGGIAIGKAYLGENLVYNSAGGGVTPVLPYDAEVEYLESSGTQYIDTGIVPTASTGFYTHISKAASTDQYAIGLRETTGNTRWCAGNNGIWYYGYGSYSASTGIGGLVADIKLNWLNDGVFYTENGTTTKTSTLPTLSFTPTSNIRLFGSAGVSGSYTKCSCAITFVKISDGINIVMDMIPVRVGQVGYMYDKVSGQLFGNNGSGTFILGNDKS